MIIIKVLTVGFRVQRASGFKFNVQFNQAWWFNKSYLLGVISRVKVSEKSVLPTYNNFYNLWKYVTQYDRVYLAAAFKMFSLDFYCCFYVARKFIFKTDI